MTSQPPDAQCTSKKRSKKSTGLSTREEITLLKIIGELNNDVIDVLVDTFFSRDADDGVNVVVASEGGNSDVYSVFIDCTRRHRDAGSLLTLAAGEVYSGAPIIVAAGSPGKRCSYEHCLFGLHEPYLQETTGDPAVLKSELQMLQSTIDRFYTILSELTGTTVKTWRSRLSGKSMVGFDAKQALRWGLIDKII
jgi:ATP-dependent Clp protease, protease subunit